MNALRYWFVAAIILLLLCQGSAHTVWEEPQMVECPADPAADGMKMKLNRLRSTTRPLGTRGCTCVPVQDIMIDGPEMGVVGSSYTFTAAISPINATQPIDYVWRASDQTEAVVHKDGQGDTADFRWSKQGPKTITVTTSNCGGTVIGSDPHSITINVPLTGVVVTGPTTGIVSTSYTFTATVSPLSATTPVTYVWWATDQLPVTCTRGLSDTGHLSDTATFTWTTSGSKTVTVTATNAASAVTDTCNVIVEPCKVNFPLIMCCSPCITLTPTLDPILPPGRDAVYTVSWYNTIPCLNPTYTVQEDIDGSFPNPSEVYEGPDASHSVNDRGATRRYYRVKVRNDCGESDWSNVESVDVLWEAEPNNGCLPDLAVEANGPLASGITYSGTLRTTSVADTNDCFYFDKDARNTIDMKLTNIPLGCDFDLQLRDSDRDLVAESLHSGNTDEHILIEGFNGIGRYYVRVRYYQGEECSQPYNLWVRYE